MNDYSCNTTQSAADEVYVFPTSFAQQRLWFLHQLEPRSASYNISKAMRLVGDIDVVVFTRVLDEIVRRHEVLRTTFAMLGGRPMQLIAGHRQLTLPLIDLSALAPAASQREAQRLFTAQARGSFNLRRGPLLRVIIVRLCAQEHVALFTMHHIISDGWSVSIFVKEFTVLYQAFVAGRPSPLAELEIQYADYAEWQRGYLQGDVLERQLAYWRAQLAGAPLVLELPTDRARPSALGDSGAKASFELGTESLETLKELSQREGATLFMAVLAVFQVLLSRYSGQSQISVGTPVAGRTRAEMEDLIGFFVNTLVLKTDLSGNPRFTELLGRVREVCLGAYAHQDVPFERLVEELQPERGLSYTPLFQVMFALQNVPSETLNLPGLKLRPFYAETKTAKFDLKLSMSETPDGLAGSIEYNTDLFNDSTVARMVAHFRMLLDDVAANPQKRISELSLLRPDERQQVIVKWNETEVDFPPAASFHELFEQQAARTPDAPALAFADTRLTYRQLNEQASQLARHLRRCQGVGPEALVGLLCERSAGMVVGLLGILKAGGAYVPLDPQQPAARLSRLLRDTRLQVLVTQAHLRPALAAAASVPHVVYLDTSAQAIAQESVANLDERPQQRVVRPENLAYVIYTSGSTGVPKGVGITHRSLSNYTRFICSKLGIMDSALDSQLHFATVSTISADLGNTCIFPALASGGCLHVLDYDTATDAGLFARYVAAHAIDVLKIVPSHLSGLLASANGQDLLPRKYLILGGEALPFKLLDRVKEQGGACRVINHYGPTEATIGSLTCEADELTEYGTLAATVPIGRPVANTSAYVLDEHFSPVPLGVEGELYLGGEGLARGYVNEPQQTAALFLPHPFSTRPGARLYRTGDRARYLPDGNLEFLGRRDAQVKVRGFRIELGEIEFAVRQHESVRECVVTAREGASGSKGLVCYVVAEPDIEVSGGELRTFLKERLPEYMVPTAWVMLETLPLTPNGKIDRRALPAPDFTTSAAASAPASTATEQTLADIWCQVLGVPEVGVTDNFFELGGDSILCIQVVARANQAGLRLSPKDLFEHQTINALANAAAERSADVRAASTGAVEDDEETAERDLPLTPIQHWFFAQQFARLQHWNQSVLLETHRRLRRAPLEDAFAALVRRHAALRLRFTQQPTGVWRQRLLATEASLGGSPAVHEVDLSLADEGARVRLLERCCAQVQVSLDLSAGPLLRFVLMSLGEEGEQRLLLVAHHLITDGVSWRILLDELHRAYEQAASGVAVELGLVGGSFADWAEGLAAYVETEEFKAQTGYWEAVERAAREFRLPVELSRGANLESSMEQVTVKLNAEQTRALLQEVPRVYRTQINDVLLTALGRALSRWTGRRRVVIELEGHGREDLGLGGRDVSGAMGWFTSHYPVVLEAEWRASGESLKAVKEQLRAVPHKGVSYGVWRFLRGDVEATAQEPPSGRDVSFNYFGQLDHVLEEDAPFAVAAESAGESRSGDNPRPFKLSVVGSVSGGELMMTWKYSRNLYLQETIDAVAADYIKALTKIIDHCRSVQDGSFTPSDFPMVNLNQQQLDKIVSRIGKARSS